MGSSTAAPSAPCTHDMTQDRQGVPAQRSARRHLSSNSFSLCFQKHHPWQAGTTLIREQNGSPSASVRALPEGHHGSPLASAVSPPPWPCQVPAHGMSTTHRGWSTRRQIHQPTSGPQPRSLSHSLMAPDSGPSLLLARGCAQHRGPGGEGGPPSTRAKGRASDNLQTPRIAWRLSRLPRV